MGKAGRYTRLLFVLGALATTTPIFGGYFIGMQLMFLLPFARRSLPATPSPLADAMRSMMRPVHLGVLILVVTHLLAAGIGWYTSPYAQPFYEVFKVAVRMTIKWGLLWFVLSESMLAAARRGWPMRDIGLWLAGGMVITLIYALVQRYTGIDWTHGLDARLGAHRFAYGVYRISGFMGHPLTLAYNLMLMICAAFALAMPLRQSLDARERRAWWVVLAAAAGILLISGSRFVLLVIPAVFALVEGRRLVKHAKWIAVIAVLLAAVLWWEGSIVGRFGEFFDQNASLTDRFPRLVYWQVHWHMFLDHPLAGVTLAGDDQAMEAYYSAIGHRDMINTAHNVFLQAMADSGILGLVGVLALLTGMIVAGRRAGHLLGHPSGIGLLTAATVLSGLMQNNLRDSEYLYALWFFLALLILRTAVLASSTSHAPSQTPFQERHERLERKSPQNFKSAKGRSDPASDLSG